MLRARKWRRQGARVLLTWWVLWLAAVALAVLTSYAGPELQTARHFSELPADTTGLNNRPFNGFPVTLYPDI